MEFVDRLKIAMETKNINQTDLSNAVGVTRQAIGQYLHGETVPNILAIKKICNHLGVSIDWLVGNESQNTEFIHALIRENNDMRARIENIRLILGGNE